MIVFPMGKPRIRVLLLVSLVHQRTRENTTIVVHLACENYSFKLIETFSHFPTSLFAKS